MRVYILRGSGALPTKGTVRKSGPVLVILVRVRHQADLEFSLELLFGERSYPAKINGEIELCAISRQLIFRGGNVYHEFRSPRRNRGRDLADNIFRNLSAV